jgi:hypothetical protein
MTEIASLELKISSDGVETAEGRLKRFAQSGDKAEGSGRKFASTLSEINAEAKRTAQTLERISTSASKMFASDVNKLAAAFRGQPMTLPGRSGELPELLRGGIGSRATDSLKMFRDAQTAASKSEADFVKGLREADAAANQHSGALGSLAAGAKGLMLPLAGAAGAAMALNKAIGEATEYENLVARLSGVTGGAEEAREEFDKLEKISDKTIFTENEMASAFLKLANVGLDPSERALKAYANMASATGQTLEGITETTISASMGMFRGLKQLGVQATAEGDRIKMTFKGVTTEIRNDAQSIQDYLVGIGETNFAGAAERQLDTMGGAVKQLEDAWGDLFREVGRNAIGEFIATGMREAAKAVNFTTEAIEALFFTMSQRPKEMSAERKDNLNGWITGALSWGGSQEEDQAKLAALLEDVSKRSRTKTQQAFEKYLAERKALMEASVKFEFDARQALADLDQAYENEVNGGGREKKANAGYEPRITPGFDIDFAQRQKDREDEIAALLERDEKMRRASDDADEQRKRDAESRARERDEILTSYLTEEQMLADTHAKRQKIIADALAHEAITKEEHDDAMRKEEEKSQKERTAFYAAQTEIGLKGAEATFGSLAAVAKKWGGEQSGTYRTLFALSKSFAMAQGALSMATGMAKALELGWPLGITAGLQVAATGANLLAQISGAEFSGAYDKGGRIPSGKVGLVGEYGPEFVRGPAEVTSRADTARAMAGGGTTIQIVNAPDTAAAHQYLRSGAGRKLIANVIREEATTIRTLARS